VGKIIGASASTIRLDTIPSGLSMPLPPSSTLLAATLPIYSGLGQAPDMLDCVAGGLVKETNQCNIINKHKNGLN